ncbi:Nucleobase-ascorbate transporter 7 [Hordeum vulgare]|nr:Nucleobase-ascorbate transporter 7 [Hordeum vulgare]
MAASGEQQQETAAAAKRRGAQPTKKARNVAAGDREPEFLGEPVPADEASAKWPQRYKRGSPQVERTCLGTVEANDTMIKSR